METLETLDISSEALEAETTPTLEAEQSKFQAGTWRFSGLVQGTEWDPSIFTRVLENCAPKFGETLKLASIFSYACRDQSIAVPPNCVAVEGYLKMKGSTVVRRGTLERRCSILIFKSNGILAMLDAVAATPTMISLHDSIAKPPCPRPASCSGLRMRCGRSARGLPWAQRRSPQPGRLGRPPSAPGRRR